MRYLSGVCFHKQLFIAYYILQTGTLYHTMVPSSGVLVVMFRLSSLVSYFLLSGGIEFLQLETLDLVNSKQTPCRAKQQ